MAVDGELDILQPGQQVATVVDPDQRLQPADRGVGEVTGGEGGRGAVQAAVGVDHDHDRVLAVVVVAEAAVGVVERRRLALPGVRLVAAVNEEVGIVDRGEDLRRAVVGAVVDDDDRRRARSSRG